MFYNTCLPVWECLDRVFLLTSCTTFSLSTPYLFKAILVRDRSDLLNQASFSSPSSWACAGLYLILLSPHFLKFFLAADGAVKFEEVVNLRASRKLFIHFKITSVCSENSKNNQPTSKGFAQTVQLNQSFT